MIPFACGENSRGGATLMLAKWIELDQGSTIDGELKIATQLAKGNIILGDKENFQKMLYVQVMGG